MSSETRLSVQPDRTTVFPQVQIERFQFHVRSSSNASQRGETNRSYLLTSVIDFRIELTFI
jgi:hypothetical protein